MLMLPISRFKYIIYTYVHAYIRMYLPTHTQFDLGGGYVVMDLPWAVLKIYQETSEKAKYIICTRVLACLVNRTSFFFFFFFLKESESSSLN